MKKIFITLLLLIIGTINFELTFAQHEFSQIFPSTLYLILAGIAFIIFVGLWIDYRLHHALTLKEVVIMALVIYPIVAGFLNNDTLLIGRFNPMGPFAENSLELSAFQAFKGMVYGASVGIIFYTLVFFASTAKHVQVLYKFIVKAVLVFVLIEVGYSLITEWQLYVFVFRYFDEGARLSITSFTSNPNIYAFNLIMGVYAIGALWQSERTWRWLYGSLGILLTGLIILTVSKTAILGLGIYLFVFIILSIHRALATKPNLRILVLSAFITVFFFGTQRAIQLELPFFTRIYHLLTESAMSSYISRTTIWLEGIWLLRDQNTFFGYGFGLSNLYLGVTTAVPVSMRISALGYQIINDRFHNGYLEILVSFGLIGTLLLTAIHVAYIKELKKFSLYHAISIPMWALIISFAVQMIFEDRILFRPDLGGVFFMALLLLPFHQPTLYNIRHEAHEQSSH
jgi:hypothetical protein